MPSGTSVALFAGEIGIKTSPISGSLTGFRAVRLISWLLFGASANDLNCTDCAPSVPAKTHRNPANRIFLLPCISRDYQSWHSLVKSTLGQTRCKSAIAFPQTLAVECDSFQTPRICAELSYRLYVLRHPLFDDRPLRSRPPISMDCANFKVESIASERYATMKHNAVQPEAARVRIMAA